MTKTHTTNYYDAFIEVAEDCPVKKAEIPGKEGSVANLQYIMLHKNPYKHTSDDVLFGVYASRNNIAKSKLKQEKEKFFSKGQPCFRSSSLTKRYGWGVHSDSEGKIALVPVDSKKYKQFKNDEKLKHLKAMRSKKA